MCAVLIPDDLTETELLVWNAIETGEFVSLPEDGSEAERDVSNGAEWGAERTIRGEALAAILTYTQQPNKPRRAVRLALARISGPLDLEALDLPCPLAFVDCFFDEAIRLSEAHLPKLTLIGCYLPELIADQIETRGSVILTRTQTRSVRLPGAHIGGQLALNGAQLSNPEGNALNADRAQIDRGMFCREGFRAEGEIRLLSTHIGGQLSFNGAQLSNPGGDALSADGAQIDGDMFCREGFRAEGEIRLPGIHISGQLALDGAQLSNPEGNALSADRAQIDRGMFCREGFRAEGEIRLLGTHIGGQLALNGAQLSNPEGKALSADGAQIDGDIFCREGFRAEGEIRLPGIHISGQLALNGAQLSNPHSNALNADRAQIDRGMFCREGFRAEGEIRLLSTHIGGQLSLEGAQLSNPGGDALSADGAQIDGDMFCDGGFRAEGAIRLPGIHISGQLALNGAQLSNPHSNALNADRAQIDEDMFCDGGFRAEGEIGLPGAHIGGQLALKDAQLSNPGELALNLCQATIAHLLLPETTAPEGILDLRDAQVKHLEDAWPTVPYEAMIGGLVYETLSPVTRGVLARLDWLANAEGGYLRQPYEQLATILRRAGRDDDARRVAIAKETSRRPELKLTGRAWNYVYGLTVGYGYAPWRGLLGLLLIFIAGCPIFACAKARGHFVVIAEKGQSLPPFHAWLYSLDCVLPVIGLGQKSYWSATGAAQYWQTFSILMGWFLVAVILAAVTTRFIRN